VRARLAALLLAACAASGCASLSDRIAAPAGHGLGLPRDFDVERNFHVHHAHWRMADGRTLAYWDVDVRQRKPSYRFTRDAHRFRFRFDTDNSSPAPAQIATRGTIVYLHGWSLDGSTMLPWAMALAERGYRGIAVDLRNAGGSSKAPAGFGPREAADVVALLEHLGAQGALREPAFLFGVSYGASTALFAEPALRGRVAGIVALEPFANAADAVRTMVPGMQADVTSTSGRMLLAVSGHRYDADAVERAIANVDQRLDLDLATIDLHAPVAQSQTCTLLLHGARDTWIPAAGSRSLAKDAPRVRYRELPDETHLTLPLRIDWLAAPLANWLSSAAAGRCDDLALPADPAGAIATQ
jgi:pimeloyl-ACP methyl ester carboxylesterase